MCDSIKGQTKTASLVSVVNTNLLFIHLLEISKNYGKKLKIVETSRILSRTQLLYSYLPDYQSNSCRSE